MQFKKAGYDVLIVRGKSAAPVSIEIINEKVTFHDATHLWGKRVMETTTALGQNNNKRNVLCIGPAGENLKPHCRHHERRSAQPGPRRPRRGDGQQKPQSHRG